MWVTNGKITDPGDGELLADTGAVAALTANATIIVTTDVAITVVLQQRNSLNTASVAEHEISSFGNVLVIPITVTLSLNQRLRVIVLTGVSGNVQASILW